VVKNVDAAELRVAADDVVAVATNFVLAAHHRKKLGAHMITSLARLHVYNFTRRSSLEAESKQEKKSREEQLNATNSAS
jgi:hypothetical protein